MDSPAPRGIIQPCPIVVPVAQLDRASASEAEGYRFESYQGYSQQLIRYTSYADLSTGRKCGLKPCRRGSLPQKGCRMSRPTSVPSYRHKQSGQAIVTQAADGDHDLLQKMAECFDRQTPVLLEQLRLAFQVGDCEAVRRAAHKLKGSVGSLGAKRASAAAAALERLKDGPSALDHDLYRRLEDEIKHVRAVLIEGTKVEA
jgi:HPt (histidine-containing phosphotransfer) domain-containing protein